MVQLTSLLVSLSVSSFPLLTGAVTISHTKRQDFSDVFAAISSLPDEAVAATIPPEAFPNQPVQETVINSVDGDLTGKDVVQVATASLPVAIDKRSGFASDFYQAFAPKASGVPDAAVEGTAYLTYKVVSNATYSVDECKQFCASVDGCIFANLYYEHNNALLDWVFSEKSNLKCALFGDFHADPSERTNKGGQQLEPEPHPLTWIEQSSGWALPESAIPEPAVPQGFSKIFGPTNGATQISEYMGFVLLSKYDVSECATQCKKRAPNSNGPCVYFNLWRAVVNGVPKSYTCSMYYKRTTTSTATNKGQGNLKVTWSRGYSLDAANSA